MDRTKVIETIRKLLALAGSDNEHEAASAAAKAQALLSAYNLSLADIPGQAQSGLEANSVHVPTRKRMEDWGHYLAHAVCFAFDCAYYYTSDGVVVIVGCGADSEVCAWTYTYLYKTMLRMGSAYLRGPRRRLRTQRSKDTARKSYLMGVFMELESRLESQSRQTPVTAPGLVESKQAVIQAAMPELTHSKIRAFKPRPDDYVRGRCDGHGVPLSRPVNGSNSQHLALA